MYGFFVQADKKSIYWLLFKTSLKLPHSSVPKVAVVERFNCTTMTINNRPLRVSKTLTFKMRPRAQPFLWKWVLFAWEWKIISMKAEHLTSFWYIGPGELGNGLFSVNHVLPPHRSVAVAMGGLFGSKCDNFSGALSSKYSLEDFKNCDFSALSP